MTVYEGWDRRGLPTAHWCPYPIVEHDMITFGVILLLIGIFVGVPLLTTLGMILAVVGVALWILGSLGRAVGGRPHYW